MIFKNELEFEENLVNLLIEQKGWNGVLNNPTEDDLIENWANILFQNNKGKDRLNNVPLTRSEMNQIIEQINGLMSPLKKNEFINGKSVSIKRDNEADTLHFGEYVSLKIYDRQEIAAGMSYYQIARQPRFTKKSSVLSDRRGDLMLLINGMPVIHIELKKSGIPLSKPIYQIQQYMKEQVFTGVFGLVQLFVVMNPEETLYFANPGEADRFNKDYFFHWADFNNEPINDWKSIADKFLSIPMAHQLIGFYTIPDTSDNVLKVLRSYQYYATNEIAKRVANIDWYEKNQLGGYIWHTTGSGKTMTSFKAAQLIATSGDADKVVFLMDRIELGTQSLAEFKSFAEFEDEIHGTESTNVLIDKLKSNKTTEVLIVTSIQKMSNIKEDGIKDADLEKIQSKRMVLIIDEAHRSTFGDMLMTIKQTFPNAIFFGFTGTPIQEENKYKDTTTATIFGNELHRYSLSDGIRDKNVLGFDVTKVPTFSDLKIRKEVALLKAKASTEEEAISDDKKAEVYYKYMDPQEITMLQIEKSIPTAQYNSESHRRTVVTDIINNFARLSRNRKFHALLATSSIQEAIAYYRLLKDNDLNLKVTAIFDNNFDYNENTLSIQEGLAEILTDYNALYNTDFSITKHALFKTDVTLRLAHKKPYNFITQEQQLDIVIVVNQLLTGYDSKFINTLYLDKIMEYDNIIQAFSRTNRLKGTEKPFGTIRYYRKVHTMEYNIEAAVKLYSGNKPFGLFVDKLGQNLKELNKITMEVNELFEAENIQNFDTHPNLIEAQNKFISLFKNLTYVLEASQIQGFDWKKSTYSCEMTAGRPSEIIEVRLNESTYQIWHQRYKELATSGSSVTGGLTESIPFDIDYEIIEKDAGRIDYDYLNANFKKYMRLKEHNGNPDEIERILNDLHRFFATLSKEQQKYANIVLYDLQNGDLVVREDNEFTDYITEYQFKKEMDQLNYLAETFGLDKVLLHNMMNLRLTENNLNEYGRFTKLTESVDLKRAKVWFEDRLQKKLKPPEVHREKDKLLKAFILDGGFNIEDYVLIAILKK